MKRLKEDPNFEVNFFLFKQSIKKPTDPGIQIIVSRDYESGNNRFKDLRLKGLIR
jgi:hypothetical protein